MTYDREEIRRRVTAKRKKLVIAFLTIAVLMVASVVLIFINLGNTVTFACIALEVLLLFAFYILYERWHPEIVFSRELVGVNIKEEEYVARRKPRASLSWRQVGGHAPPQPFAPNTGANRWSLPPNLRSRVYVRLENGDVAVMTSLYKSHTDLFTEGDTLLKYAGTRYPIVIGKPVDRQPCPLCGEMNSASGTCCSRCGLPMVPDR